MRKHADKIMITIIFLFVAFGGYRYAQEEQVIIVSAGEAGAMADTLAVDTLKFSDEGALTTITETPKDESSE